MRISDRHIHLYVRHFPFDSDVITDGTAKAVHGLALGMALCGRQVTVLCEGERTCFRRTSYGYDIASFANRWPWAGPISPDLKRYISERREDMLAVLNGVFHPSVHSLSRVLHEQKIPYIFAPHDPYCPAIFRRNAHLKWPWWYLRERSMLRGAHAVQVLDFRHGQFLKNLSIQTPVVEAPNGFFADETPDEASLGWSQSGPARLVYMGRMDVFNKGLDILLEAFAGASRAYPMTLAFRGRYNREARRLRAEAARLGIEPLVHFIAPDFARSGPNILADEGLFCMPSRFEGFGLAALDAMLAGRPVMVSEIAGIAPYVRAAECGVVVAPDRAAVQAALIDLLSRRNEWRELGLRGRRYALQHLRWREVASKALGQYASIPS